jgi:Serine acetyltransferase
MVDNARIDPGAIIGEGAEISRSAVIGSSVVLGRSVHIDAGSIVIGPCEIGDGCTIAAGCILDPSSDPAAGTLRMDPGVALLPGVMVVSKLHIGTGARILAGTVVHRSIPPHAIVQGNPAQIVGYTLSGSGAAPVLGGSSDGGTGVLESNVPGVALHRLQKVLDLRGNLSVGEFERTVPFAAKRYFMVFGVPNAEIRGEHAHRTCHQFLVCAHGRCSVVADDGAHREEFLLDDPSVGLYLPPLTWGIQYKYSADAVLVVFASEYYDSAEYIRDYDELVRLNRERRSP